MNLDFKNLTIHQIHDLLKEKRVSVLDLVNQSLHQIKAYDNKINSILNINKKAIETAKEMDKELAKNPKILNKKTLFGIPIVAKDLFSTKDLKTTAGSKIIEDYIPPYSSTVIKKLETAGAIIIAKANQDAWGHGSSGENTDQNHTRNPYNLDYVPGGSSSGSAAAVSAGMAIASTGTDTGSSIRLPASFCNLVGLKPTYGRVSRYGVMAMASSLDTIGHLTKTVLENARILDVTAGIDPYDATSSPNLPKKYEQLAQKPLFKMKIGIPKEYIKHKLNPDVEKSFNQTLDIFKKMGLKIKEISLPHTDLAMACYYIIVPAEVSSNLARFDGVRFGKGREVFGEEAKRRIMIGSFSLSSGYADAYYKQALKVRTLIKQDFDRALGEVDLIFAPTSTTPAFKIGEKTDPLQMYLSDIFTCPLNLAGHPGLNIPIGFSKKGLSSESVGLPIGAQIIGPHFSEDKIYNLAYHLEQKTLFYKTTAKL
jgi:aspartyl-tRNA(Asn)/glutamyl-tRNA(Gln) amidotransferase subunit A